MAKESFGRKTIILWVLIGLTVAYGGLLLGLGTLTGRPLIDGSMGVVLGLYVCSHPAANAIDLLFMERTNPNRVASGWPAVRWVALNLLVMVMGWSAIFIGATQFANRSS
jgi:hypothetical protein